MTEPSEVLINAPGWQEGAQIKISLSASAFSRFLPRKTLVVTQMMTQTWDPWLYSHRAIRQLLTIPEATGYVKASAFCFTVRKTGKGVGDLFIQ